MTHFFFCNIREREEQPGTSTTEESSSRHNSREDDEDDAEPSTSRAGNQDEDGAEKGDKDEEEKGEVVEAVLTEEDLIQQSQAEYDSGRYSPSLLTSSELPLDSHTITPEEDIHRLQLARRQLQVTGTRRMKQSLMYKVCWIYKCVMYISPQVAHCRFFAFLYQVTPTRVQKTPSYVVPERAWAPMRPSSVLSFPSRGRCTCGRTNTVPENRASSTGSTRASSGTNTTRRIMTSTTLRPRSCRATSSTSSTRT